MDKKRLQIQQLNSKIMLFDNGVKMPDIGWIKAIRTSLGMSMQQLANKLSVSKQNIDNLEKSEKEGTITLKSLKEVAKAMDMQLVYALVPNDGSLNALIERKAREIATQIVLRTSNTMKLEDQENTKQRIEKAIEERTIEIKNSLPKILWD
jgi:predicted DNA-binding mobile mystery protein A